MRRNGLLSLIFIVLLSAGGIVWTVAADNEPLLGLDLQGGISVVLEPTEEASEGAITQAIQIIRQRVDAIGVAEPEISRQGDAIVVQLPGVDDRERALELVGQTAELRFRPVLQALPPGDPESELSTEDEADEEVVLAEYDDEGAEVARFRLGPTEATGDILRGADAQLFELGQWQVAVQVRGGRIDEFNEIAGRCFNGDPSCPSRQLAIVLDERVVSAPAINAPSFDPDQVSITGQFTEREAKDLALVLRYGALPVELEPQQTQSVSATLGDDALDAGLTAGLIGLGLVTLYMIVYYRLLGLVAILSLLVAAALLWTAVAWLGDSQGLALTLAGVTGIILSVGVAVDSNVVFYEHLKEEVSKGRSLRAAVDGSFTSAFSTIVKADLASLIGAGILYWLTVGPVRGFALFLGLSTLLDLVAAYFFMRPVTLMLVKSKRLQQNRRLFGMPKPVHHADPSARPVEEGVPA
ncbi:MAG TPA: protein translocase subunit SecD [Nocardioides sp.]|nr:protein translocase subunit SecD [Nocardioides sp.]